MNWNRAAVLTLSDKGARGERVDQSGPALVAWLAKHQVDTVAQAILPDELDSIAEQLTNWADADVADLILTTGGTGLSPRDVTPEATRQVIDRPVPGLAELMRLESLKITPMAALSRAEVGIRKRVLIVNLPGSPKAALENLQAIWPVLGHGIDKMRGDQQDCAGRFGV
ncbi:MAG: molybdenum cofactor biosynthesis protein [Desulfuromonas sp.]|nr:MAG: molybdenum cofactor biosynthesis protein [Desulfuromonas sp.]